MAGEVVSELMWFALRVIPQREMMAAKILRYFGVDAAIKTEKRLRRTTKWDKERKPIEFCAAPGYVFIAIPRGKPTPWGAIFKLHLIRSVVSIEGVPAELNHEAVMKFLGFEDMSLPNYFRFFSTRGHQFEIGDEVVITTGVLSEQKLRVEDVREGEAIFIIRMLGATKEISVPVNDCFKAEAA